jgi:thiol:disulfide interchange protein DsbD
VRRLFALALFAAASAALAGSPPKPSELLTVTASISPGAAAGAGTLHVEAKLSAGWHVNSHHPSEDYLIPTNVELLPAEGVRPGDPRYPEGKLKKFAFSDAPLSVYENEFAIEIPLEWTGGAPPAVSGSLHFQACNDAQCLAPASIAFRSGPSGTGTAGAAASGGNGEPLGGGAISLSEARRVQEEAPAGTAGASRDFGDLLERRGLLIVLLSIFVGGLALNLTPCVYPIIPLTVGFFGRESQGSTSRAFALSSLYVLGMATTYSALGVAAALSGKLFGTLLQNPFVLAGIAAVLVAMALSMFGMWEIRMPSLLMNKAGARSGPFGAFAMGLFVGVVAAPCIGGFIVGLLAFVAARQDALLGLLFFFVLSLGLGLPYLFLGAFSGSLSRLPRAGAWMDSVKKVFGWVLLAMAAYFLRSVAPAPYGAWLLPATLAIAIVVLLVRGFGLGWPIRAAVALLFLGVALFFVPRSLAEWRPYDAEQAATAGRPAIIDFSAEWCLPCLELERRTFSDARVRDALRSRELFRADMTRTGSPEAVALAEKYSILGVPTIIFLDASGHERKDLRLVGFEDADAFLGRLQKAP